MGSPGDTTQTSRGNSTCRLAVFRLLEITGFCSLVLRPSVMPDSMNILSLADLTELNCSSSQETSMISRPNMKLRCSIFWRERDTQVFTRPVPIAYHGPRCLYRDP